MVKPVNYAAKCMEISGPSHKSMHQNNKTEHNTNNILSFSRRNEQSLVNTEEEKVANDGFVTFSEFLLREGIVDIKPCEMDGHLLRYLKETNQVISKVEIENGNITSDNYPGHVERVMRQRAVADTALLEAADRESGQVYPRSFEHAVTIPKTWEEAKAQVPGLSKWVTIKAAALAANPNRPVYDILVEHLRNADTGLGKWTTEGGLPKKLLRKIDESLRQEIMGIKSNNLPSDIKLLDGTPGRPKNGETPTSEQVREARRISSLGTRRGI